MAGLEDDRRQSQRHPRDEKSEKQDCRFHGRPTAGSVEFAQPLAESFRKPLCRKPPGPSIRKLCRTSLCGFRPGAIDIYRWHRDDPGVVPKPLDDVVENYAAADCRSEEHTSELQSLRHLVCRLLLEKKKQ